MIDRKNLFLAVLLLVIVIATQAIDIDYSKPNIEILPDMKYTPAFDAFAANPIFKSGQTMQLPVPGTIARGQMPLHYDATKEDAIRAGSELESPYCLSAIGAAVASERIAASASTSGSDSATAPLSEEAIRDSLVRERLAASVERGGAVYRTFCVPCHGPQGAGNGPVAQRGFPPPPSMLTGKSLQMKDGQLFHILTYGQGSMKSFAGQLTPENRWDVINFVRDLQSKAPPASLEPMPQKVPNQPALDNGLESEKSPATTTDVPPVEPDSESPSNPLRDPRTNNLELKSHGNDRSY